MSIPVTASRTLTSSDPFYVNRTDLRADAIEGLRTPQSNATTLSFQARRLRRAPSGIAHFLLDPLALTGSFVSGNSRTELSRSSASNYALTLDYALGDYNISESATTWNGTPLPANAEDRQTYEYVGLTFAPQMGPYYFLGRTNYKALNTGEPTAGRIPGTAKDGYWFEIGKSFEIMDDLEFAVAALYSGDVPQYPSTSPSSRSSSSSSGRSPAAASPCRSRSR